MRVFQTDSKSNWSIVFKQIVEKAKVFFVSLSFFQELNKKKEKYSLPINKENSTFLMIQRSIFF